MARFGQYIQPVACGPLGCHRDMTMEISVPASERGRRSVPLEASSPPAVAAAPSRDPFARFLVPVAVLATLAAAMEMVGAAADRNASLAAEAVLTAAFVVGLLVARIQIRTGDLVRARAWFAVGITLDGAVGAVLVPGLAPATAVLPGLSVLLVLPHLRRAQVAPVIALAALASGGLFLLDRVSHPLGALQGPAGILFPTAVFVGVMVLVMGGLAAFAMDARAAVAEVQDGAAREAKAGAERLAIVGALRTLVARETPEDTATALATALASLPQVDLGVIMEASHGVLTILAIAGREPHPVRPGDRFPDDRAAYLIGRSAAGAWAERWADRPVPGLADGPLTARGIEGEAFAPIFVDSELVGLVCILTNDAEQARHLVADLPAVREFATVASAILAPSLVARHHLATVRTQVEQIIADRRFRIVFQPIVELQTGRAVGYEALTRFADGTPPDQMFSQARHAGVGLALETATLQAAVREAADLPGRAWLALNASAGLITSGALARDLVGASRSIVIEVTEHEPVDDYPAIRAAIAAGGANIRVAVDDAGAGVANFSHIVELRPDFVKLDASIIQGIDRDPTRQALVVGLHQFARSLGHDVIAEGVETEAELAVLRRLGITLAQGYRLGRPASVAANGSRASGTEPPGEPSRVAPSTRQPTVTTPGGS